MAISRLKDRGPVKIILLFDPSQCSRFKKYLASPYFNSNKLLLSLFQTLLKIGKSKRLEKLSIADLGTEMSVAVSTLEKSFSHLMDHLRKFLEIELLEQDENRSFGKLLTALRELELPDSEYKKEHRKFARKVAKLPESTQRLHQSLELEYSVLKAQINSPRKGGNDLFTGIMNHLDAYYFVSKTKYACSQLNAWRIYGGAPPAKMEHLFSTEIAASKDSFPALGQAYFHLGCLLEKEGETLDLFETTFAYFNAHFDQFAWEDQIDLYGYLLNSCFRMVALGKRNYIEKVHLIYTNMLDQKLIVVHGKINSAHFKNIVSIRVLLGKITEAEQFIEDYQGYLDEQEQHLVVKYTQGVIAFNKGEFKAAIQLFKKVIELSPEDLFWSLESRNMLWKAYFEGYADLTMEEHDEMQRHYHAFRQYLSRTQKLSDYHKATYQNFLKLFHTLVKLAFETLPFPDQEIWNNLLSEVEDQTAVTNKKWLIEKIQSFQ